MNWKLIFRGLRHASLRRKIFAVFGILMVYRMLSHIPIPIAETVVLEQFINNLLNSENVPTLLSQINILTGGALASLSIMLVGLGPYITASIVLQVLTKTIPKLEEMQKEGEYGRKKISQYTRILTLPLAIFQSITMIIIVGQISGQFSGLGNLVSQASLSDWIFMVFVLTTAAMILMWLGELITERGIGNGISLLITVAIVSQIPFMFSQIYDSIGGADVDPVTNQPIPYEIFGWLELNISAAVLKFTGWLILVTFLMTLCVVYLNEAYRKIKLSYAKRVQGNRLYSDVSTFLPLKLIAAGVIPIIFAAVFLALPQMFGNLFASHDGWLGSLANNLLTWFTAPGTGVKQYSTGFNSLTDYIYPVSYFLLVVLFTYFYTNIVFSAKDISERLQRQGGFIEGVRPGLETQKFLAKSVNQLNFFGSISLAFLAITPIIFQARYGYSGGQLFLAGTAILILVAVALETLRQIESQALMATYEDSQDEK